jgi:hypothetical protein
MPVRLGPFYVAHPIRSVREQAGYSVLQATRPPLQQKNIDFAAISLIQYSNRWYEQRRLTKS